MNKIQAKNAKRLDQLKYKMSHARSVEEWNLLRNEAKKEFGTEIINRLDASGFINRIVTKGEGHKYRVEYHDKYPDDDTGTDN